MAGRMWKTCLKYIPLVLLLFALLLPACDAMGQPGKMEDVLSLPQLSLQLDEFIGKKVWVLGVYGDSKFGSDGAAFLVMNYLMLLVNEELPEYSFARLDGKLPPADMNSAQIIVYGKVNDFSQTYGVFTTSPTPLITVEKYQMISPPTDEWSWSDSIPELPDLENLLLFPATKAYADDATATGTKAEDCDRALIISGGKDTNNNKPHYKHNVAAKYKKLKELGFSAKQIEIVYYDGSSLKIDGVNVPTQAAKKQNVKNIIDKYKSEMKGSCTLTIFVTDHGEGYNEAQGYDGARPAFLGESEHTNGITYPESTFKIDLRKYVSQSTAQFAAGGRVWRAVKDKLGQVHLLKVQGNKLIYKGHDANGSGNITEAEIGEDLNGDGDSNDPAGFSVAALEKRLQPAWFHGKKNWDTDADGNPDVRAEWDGNKFVVKRKTGSGWAEIGKDTNGDFIIDGADGGIDWNLNGNTNDRIGFHEGITLLGGEMLWDDELAGMLKPLKDQGVHILVEMMQCFSGGFIPNLQGTVEKIVTAASEDDKSRARIDKANRYTDSNLYDAFELGFIDNLHGIDIESWNTAFDKAKEIDEKAWTAEGSPAERVNKYQIWEKPVVETDSTFSEQDKDYTLVLRLPEGLKDKVYDLEIFYGLQKPRWPTGMVSALPEGFTGDTIPGGLRVRSAKPFPLDPLIFKLRGAEGAKTLRVQLTNDKHEPIGYVLPRETAPMPTAEEAIGIDLDPKAACVPMEGGCIGIVEVYLAAKDLTGGNSPITRVVLNANGKPWYDSNTEGTISTDHFEKTIPTQVGCGHRYLLEVIATNANGQTFSVTKEIVVPDCPPAGTSTPTPQPEPSPTPTPTAEETIYVAFFAQAKSSGYGSECVSEVSVAMQAKDLSGGKYPIKSITLKVNGQVWDSKTSPPFYKVVTKNGLACGQTFSIEVTATNSIGQTVTSTGAVTTPIP